MHASDSTREKTVEGLHPDVVVQSYHAGTQRSLDQLDHLARLADSLTKDSVTENGVEAAITVAMKLRALTNDVLAYTPEQVTVRQRILDRVTRIAQRLTSDSVPKPLQPLARQAGQNLVANARKFSN
jgi:hypothetical protein